MKKDPRIEVQNPWVAQHEAERERVKAEVRARFSDAEWSMIIAPLADLVRKLTGGEPVSDEPAPPAGLTPELVHSWKTISRALLGREPPEQLENVPAILAERLCASLATEPGPSFADWLRLVGILERIGAESLFIDHLTPDLLRSHAQELLKLPVYVSPLEVVETHGPLGDPKTQQRYLKDLPAREASAVDRWAWLEELKRDANSCLFREPLWIQNRLLGRVGGSHWLRFVHALPYALLRELVVRDLQSPDEVLELIGLEFDGEVAGGPIEEEVLVLLVQRMFELWKQIHLNLVEMASGRLHDASEPPELLERARAAEKDWRDRELPERARALANRLLQGSGRDTGFKVSALALRHLFVPNIQWSLQESKNEATPVIRNALIQGLTKSGRPLDEIVGAILGARMTKPSLLSAALVVLEDTDSFSEEQRSEQAERIWAAYGHQIETNPFFLNGLPRGDEELLARALGAMLARQPEPETAFVALFTSVRRPAEGWKVDYKQFLDSIQKVLHLLVVGAMASEWRTMRGQSGKPLFQFVWKRLHAWLRTPFGPIAEAEVQYALANVWGRLWLIEGPASTGYALAELSRLDRLDWIVLAANHLRNNMLPFGGPASLPLELQDFIWSRFKRMFPIIKLRRSVKQEQVVQYERDVMALTPDIHRGGYSS